MHEKQESTGHRSAAMHWEQNISPHIVLILLISVGAWNARTRLFKPSRAMGCLKPKKDKT